MDKLLSQSDVCCLLKITPNTLRTYRKNGLAFMRMPGAKGRGGKIVFRMQDVESFLEKSMVKYDESMVIRCDLYQGCF